MTQQIPLERKSPLKRKSDTFTKETYTKKIHNTISNGKNWKQLKSPFIGEWVNKLYIHTIKYYQQGECTIATSDIIKNHSNII